MVFLMKLQAFMFCSNLTSQHAEFIYGIYRIIPFTSLSFKMDSSIFEFAHVSQKLKNWAQLFKANDVVS